MDIKLTFEEQVQLYEDDPVAFEEYRITQIEELINKCDEQRQERLRRLQWKIDIVRNKTKNPVVNCIAISDMMWDSLERLNTMYNDSGFSLDANGNPISVTDVRTKATILPFKQSDENDNSKNIQK